MEARNKEVKDGVKSERLAIIRLSCDRTGDPVYSLFAEIIRSACLDRSCKDPDCIICLESLNTSPLLFVCPMATDTMDSRC